MSRVAPTQAAPADATPRGAMTQGRRQRVIARQDGVCAYPECAVTDGLEIDHVVPLELGGKDTDDNCQALCEAHHKQKTRLDLKMIAKARRLRVKNGPKDQRPRAQPIRSRGFSNRWRRYERREDD